MTGRRTGLRTVIQDGTNAVLAAQPEYLQIVSRLECDSAETARHGIPGH
jgi:hypothetical protein